MIMTVRDEESALPALLNSLQKQERRPDEIVIADGGSTDETIPLLRAFAFEHRHVTLLELPGPKHCTGPQRCNCKRQPETLSPSPMPESHCLPAGLRSWCVLSSANRRSTWSAASRARLPRRASKSSWRQRLCRWLAKFASPRILHQAGLWRFAASSGRRQVAIRNGSTIAKMWYSTLNARLLARTLSSSPRQPCAFVLVPNLRSVLLAVLSLRPR